MFENLDPTTLFGATGAASLLLYIIWTDKKYIAELKELLVVAADKKEIAQKETADITVETTGVLKDMEHTIQKVNENHDRIDAALQLILGKL